MKNTVILLVDDDIEDCEIFNEAILRLNKNIVVDISNNSLQALNNLKTAKELPDFIFLDMQMPHLTGTEFVHELEKISELSEIQVVIYSSHLEETLAKIMEQFKSVRFFTKPNSFTELIKILDSIL